LFRKFKDQTIAALTGFILGSLGVIWPWKDAIIKIFGEKEKVVGYDFYLPQLNTELFIALAIMIVGVVSIWLMEKSAASVENK